MRYDAFISYKHGDDTPEAEGLQYSLQHLAKPWYRRRAMEVFRDDTHMAAGDLAEKIQDGLTESRYYLLVASPGSAKSPWVGEEIKYWAATKVAASERMLIALVDGTLEWDKDAGCFVPERSTALHPELLDVFRGTPPLWIDLTQGRGPDATDTATESPREFGRRHRTQVAKLAARIHEVELPAIIDADQTEHRRTLRLAWTAVVVLVLLTIAAVFGFVDASRNADEARAQTRNAQSGELASRSGARLTTDAPLALATAVAANQQAPSSLARDALQTAAALPITAAFGPGEGAADTGSTATAASADGRRIATSDGTRVSVRDVATGRQIAEWTDPDARPVQELALDHDGGRLAVSYTVPAPEASDVVGALGRTAVWDVDRRRTVGVWDHHDAALRNIEFSPAGTTLAGADDLSNFVQWNPATGESTEIHSASPAVVATAFNGDGSRVAVVGGNANDSISMDAGAAQLWDTTTGTLLGQYPLGTNVTAIALSPNGQTFATGAVGGSVQLWDLSSGTARTTWTSAGGITHLAYNESGNLLAIGDDTGSVVVRDVQTDETVTTWQAGTSVTSLAFTDRGRAIATGDDRGHVVVRDAHALSRRATTPTPVDAVATTDDGSALVAIGRARTSDFFGPRSSAVRWDAARGGLREFDVGSAVISAVSADGRRVALGRYSTSPAGFGIDVSVFDTATGAAVDSWNVPGTGGAIALAPDDSFLVSSAFSDGKNRLQVHALPASGSGTSSARVPELDAATKGTLMTSISVADDHSILTVDQSGTTTLWKPDGTRHVIIDGTRTAPTGRPRVPAVEQATVRPDGQAVATIDGVLGTSTRQVHLWPARGGRPTTHRCADTSNPTAVALSPDGHTLAIGDGEHHVTLCTISDDRAIASWTVAGKVTSLAFAANGKWLAAGDDAGNITRLDASVYRASPAALSTRLCHALRGYRPTAAERKIAGQYKDYRDLCR